MGFFVWASLHFFFIQLWMQSHILGSYQLHVFIAKPDPGESEHGPAPTPLGQGLQQNVFFHAFSAFESFTLSLSAASTYPGYG